MNSRSVTFTCENSLFNKDMLFRLTYGHSEKICRYFLKFPYGLYLLRQLSERDLLFLMPNNVKRRLGLPMTRVAAHGIKRGMKVRDYLRPQKLLLLWRGTMEYRKLLRLHEARTDEETKE